MSTSARKKPRVGTGGPWGTGWRLRGWFGTLRVRLTGSRILVAAGELMGITPCGHPAKALTACTYQQTPKGKWGWYYRCRACLGWFSC